VLNRGGRVWQLTRCFAMGWTDGLNPLDHQMAVTDFSKLHHDVVFGKARGKIIWQPRVGCWYEDKMFAGVPLPSPFTGMQLPQIYRELGCSARIYEYYLCYQRCEHPSVKFVKRQLNETDWETKIVTPAGIQVLVTRKTPSSHHEITVKWEVETEEELKVAAWREENVSWKWDQKKFDEIQNKWGSVGAATMFILFPRMNIQSLYIEKMGVEKGVLALYDWPDTVHAYFRAVDEAHDRFIDVINESPIDIINLGENVHAGTLSPDLFLKYHLPACQRRCERLHRAHKFVSSHWDGNTKPLLKYARETGLDGIEALTPAPQGDVTLEEIKEGLGDDLFLLDGLPAILFDDTYPVSMLEEYAHKIIELFAPRLVLGISDELSSTGDIERVRLVGEIVNRYNSRIGGN
jgi:hypothetical protein